MNSLQEYINSPDFETARRNRIQEKQRKQDAQKQGSPAAAKRPSVAPASGNNSALIDVFGTGTQQTAKQPPSNATFDPFAQLASAPQPTQQSMTAVPQFQAHGAVISALYTPIMTLPCRVQEPWTFLPQLRRYLRAITTHLPCFSLLKASRPALRFHSSSHRCHSISSKLAPVPLQRILFSSRIHSAPFKRQSKHSNVLRLK